MSNPMSQLTLTPRRSWFNSHDYELRLWVPTEDAEVENKVEA
jgi:hypothetical protein